MLNYAESRKSSKITVVAEGFQELTVTCAKCLSPLIPCHRSILLTFTDIKLDTTFLENLFLIAESCVKLSYEEAALSIPRANPYVR